MNPRRATRTAGVRVHHHRARLLRSGLLGWCAAFALVLALIAAGPQAAAEPAQPAAPQATTTPSGSPSPSQTGTSAPTPSSAPTRRPDPEGDRWVQLAVVGGGSLLGAVVMFMVIGGIIRAVNRRRYRR